MQYNRYKDADPKDTIKTISSIIGKIGLEVCVSWTESDIQNIYSNHVSILNTSFGTNGKGTSKDYALASGYAELIERMQNGILNVGVHYSESEMSGGFLYCPDEKILTTDELIKQDDKFLNYYFNYFYIKTYNEKVHFLENLPKMESIPAGLFRCMPFSDVITGHIVYIPADILFPIYGSNGMAAGNTIEEALVQALSEIVERYANKSILEGVIPPEVPREYFEDSAITRLINEIEKGGTYRVSVRDCSLGKDFPVAAIVISDLKSGKFSVHFGAHPSFEISVERCLTEALQGKNIRSAVCMNEIGDNRMCGSIDNTPNIMKLGYGAYPIGFFADVPSYKFEPHNEWTDMSNLQMLKKLLSVIERAGFDVLIRDASHLGFPSYQVIIPGMSELFFTNGYRFKELRTANKVQSSFKNFPDFTKEEEERLLLYIKYKQYSIMENSFAWIAGIPFTGEQYSIERIRAFLHYKRGEYDQSYEWFRRAAELTNDENERSILLCAAEYSWLMQICGEPEKIARGLKCYFCEDTVKIVHNIMSNVSESMKKAFEHLPCHKCIKCAHNGIDCAYSQNDEALLKIKLAIAQSTVDQTKVLNYFRINNLM